jgi:hypothetical protein
MTKAAMTISRMRATTAPAIAPMSVVLGELLDEGAALVEAAGRGGERQGG